MSVNAPGDDFDARLPELVMKWEELVASGSHPSSAEMCCDCPELIAEFEHSIQQLQTLDRFLSMDSSTSAGLSTRLILSSKQSDRFPQVPGYCVLEEIGRGGMGVVYKARQNSLDRLVAIKTLPGSRWGQSGFVARLRQEAKGLSLLSHPNVVKVFDVVETPVVIAVILEYVDGESLAKSLNRAAMPPRDAAMLTLTLARTLMFVHQRGLLHRDIKPSNVMIGRNGDIKLADFGLVKEQGSDTSLTATGDLFGTPSYMAPEQVQGKDAFVDCRTDVYALGATLYEMLTGRPPFVGVSTLDTLDQVQHREPIAIRLLSPGVPRDLETICLKCLDKEPERRFGNAQELVMELERFERGIPIRARPAGILYRCRRWCRRKPTVAALSVFSLLAVVAIVGLLATYNRDLTRLNADLDRAATNAKNLQRIAEDRERQTNDSLYAADINRAGMAWQQNDTRVLTTLLEQHIPRPGEADYRGWAWWFLRRQAHFGRKTLLEIGSPQYIVCHSQDRRLWAVAGSDSIVRFFNPETGETHRELSTGQIEVNGLAFSPDGQELATAGDDGTVRIWNLASLSERLMFIAHPTKAFQVVYTHDGSELIVCGDDPIIRAFDTKSGQSKYTLEGHEKTIQCLLLDHDGQTLISTSNDHDVRFWDLSKRIQSWSFRSSSDVTSVVFDRKRNLLVIGNSGGLLQSLDVHDNRELASAKHLDKVGALAVHPDGLLLAAGDSGGQIRLRGLDPQGNFVGDQHQPWQAHQGIIYSLCWSHDGSRLISTGQDGRVMSWNLTEVRPDTSNTLELHVSTHSCLVPGTTSVLAKSPFKLVIWDWMQKRTLASSESLFHGAATVSPDGDRFATVLLSKERANDSLRLYNLPKKFNAILDEASISGWETGRRNQQHPFLAGFEFPCSITLA